MRFITDGMLGKLTRWLRLAGEDVICVNDYSISPEEEDRFLLEKAEEDSRILLTRDKNLYKRALKDKLNSILIENESDVAKQLSKISESIDGSIEINIGRSRCPACNGQLSSIEKSSVPEKIPNSVLENNDSFWECEKCGKIYWPGTPWDKMTEVIEEFEKLRG